MMMIVCNDEWEVLCSRDTRGIFILSRFAAAKTKIETDVDIQENTGWGGINSPLLYQNQTEEEKGLLPTSSNNGPCDDQRYEIDYLALHSTWHSLSGISILLTIIIIQIALKSNFSLATTSARMPA